MIQISKPHKDANGQTIDDRILPLINIVFLLLIFFMVAGALRAPEPFEITAPESTAETPMEDPELVIFMAEDGRIALDEQAVLVREQIGSVIKPKLMETPDQRIRIVADQGAKAVEVIALMEELRGIGAERVRLTTRGMEAGS